MLLDELSTELWRLHRQAWNAELAQACDRLTGFLAHRRSRHDRAWSAAAAMLLSGALLGTATLPAWLA
ncbi:hypothetical protein IP88_06720 [alpha proteobacterium AAP81b]|nr:hypothetical protein IP88_06720 [alpha proteobacterium AAP81b]